MSHLMFAESLKAILIGLPFSHFDRPTTEARIPIIIVPAAATAMLTLHNIKQFLESQMYVYYSGSNLFGGREGRREGGGT